MLTPSLGLVLLASAGIAECRSLLDVHHVHRRIRRQNEDPTGLFLVASAVQSGSAADGSLDGVSAPGQSKSQVSDNNFINFCQGKTLTNGLQVQGGSCNGIPMGEIPSKQNMVSSIITFPLPGSATLEEKTDFSISVQMINFVAGSFTNAQATYYSAPQALSGGKVVGHTHVTVQSMGPDLNPQQPLDPTTFVFFKGINDAGDGNGLLSAKVPGGLPAGNYRVCTMASASNHQLVLMPVAQRGAQDDCTKFTIIAAGAGGNGGGNGGNGQGVSSSLQVAAESSTTFAESSTSAASATSASEASTTLPILSSSPPPFANSSFVAVKTTTSRRRGGKTRKTTKLTSTTTSVAAGNGNAKPSSSTTLAAAAVSTTTSAQLSTKATTTSSILVASSVAPPALSTTRRAGNNAGGNGQNGGKNNNKPTIKIIKVVHKITIIRTFFTFKNSLGGLPPAVNKKGNLFAVLDQLFDSLTSACDAACGAQYDTCISFSGPGFEVVKCKQQRKDCGAAAQIVTSAAAETPKTVTATVTVPPSASVPGQVIGEETVVSTVEIPASSAASAQPTLVGDAPIAAPTANQGASSIEPVAAPTVIKEEDTSPVQTTAPIFTPKATPSACTQITKTVFADPTTVSIIPSATAIPTINKPLFSNSTTSVTPTLPVSVSPTPIPSSSAPAPATEAVAGIPAPAITASGDAARPFEVNGNTFTTEAAAKQRSCDIQFNKCADAVNGGKAIGVAVGDCQKQKEACPV